jgi:hypothetical protein
VCHLKRWTLRSLVSTDVFDRGIPWTQLILREGRFESDLNVRVSQRASVALAYLFVGLSVLSVWHAWLIIPAVAAAAELVGLSWPLYRFFLSRRGLLFAIGAFPLQLLYHLYNGVSFVIGTVVYLVERWTGLRIPGSVPQTRWSGPLPPADASRASDPR